MYVCKCVWLGIAGFPPIFKRKIHDKAYNVGDKCALFVHVTGNPPPGVSWYRNDELLTDGGRVRTSSNADTGRHSLVVLSTKPNDLGVFKCVARNKFGTATCRARLLFGGRHQYSVQHVIMCFVPNVFKMVCQFLITCKAKPLHAACGKIVRIWCNVVMVYAV